MYLKSIELQGFKSFPDKSKLTFDRSGNRTDEAGVTVIVGPNGSGKSNIADAMRWVLGEVSKKTLRSSKMEDVIFGGADSRRPMGYAEVSVTFDNTSGVGRLDCNYDEVTVTRRYFRSGDSEYYINRRAVRLRDIYELFMNTGIGRDGYSIIGQGRIAEIISQKSDERRSIFEDASGIAKYRSRKDEAERKLQATDDNMTRVMDIFAEVEAQIGPLEKEAEKARRAIDLLEKKKQADISLWLYDTEKLRAELTAAEENYTHSGYDMQNIEDVLQSLAAQTGRLLEASKGAKEASNELLAKIQVQTEANHKLDNEYRVTENNIGHTKELIATAEGAMQSTDKSVERELTECGTHADRISALEAEAAQVAASRERMEAERKGEAERAEHLADTVAEALGSIRAAEAEQTDVRVRISVLENAKTDDHDKSSAILTEVAGYRNIAAELDKKIKDKEASVASYDAQIGEIDESAAMIAASAEAKKAELEEAETRLNNSRLRVQSAEQKVATFRAMEENFEGYSGAVRYVMNRYAEGKITDRNGAPCGTVFGPLSQLITVDPKYVVALETSLGMNLQHIVVEDEETAKAAMFALKRGEAGKATFFPLTSMSPRTETPEMKQAKGYDGYVGVADELITCDPKFRNVISSLLGHTLIFDTIDHANVMARGVRFRVRVVTLDGQQINAGGSFTGGSVRQGGGMLSRAGEIKRLEEELETLNKTLRSYETERAKLEAEYRDANDSRASGEEKKGILQMLRGEEVAELEQLKAKSDANRTLLEKLEADSKKLIEMRAQYEDDLATLSANAKELETRIGELTAFRVKTEEDRQDALDAVAEYDRKLTELLIRSSEIQKDIDTERTLLASAEDRISAYRSDKDTQKERIRQLNSQLDAMAQFIKDNREEFADGEKQLAELNRKRNEVESGNSEFEKKLSDLTERTRQKNEEKERIVTEHTKNEAKLARLRERQDALSSSLMEEHGLTRADALKLGYPQVTAETRAEVFRTQTECKNKLRAIGSVDLDAVSKYDELKTRYDYMKGQIEDLTRAKEELTGIISDLETNMKEAFVRAFDQINENFNKTFSELFGGGSAELSLSDPENVLESGIEIKAAPPGKIIKNLMQLSGGEQSFIGVALFFAILQVNPTPFCILDEIEAALDEVNVERLAQYIKRYSHGTQFIMISHRRGTMAAADRLYGVTMPEHGISKVLTLDINQISKEKGDDWDGIFGQIESGS